MTSTVAGTQYLQYLPQLMGWPLLADTDVATTLADAPMGVALPPTVLLPDISATEQLSVYTASSLRLSTTYEYDVLLFFLRYLLRSMLSLVNCPELVIISASKTGLKLL